MQDLLSNECHAIGSIWRDFDKHPILKREMNMGLMVAKKTLPESFHEYIEIEVDPFSYSIDFYVHVGVAEDVKYCSCSECT